MNFNKTIDEPSIPTKLGAGSFAAVFVVRGGLVAYKQVTRSSESAVLRREYNLLHQTIYPLCNSDSFFSLPRAYAYNDPSIVSGEIKFLSSTPRPSATSGRTTHLMITPDIMALFENPTYAMDRVHALPYAAGKFIAEAYFPDDLKNITPALCRLYFGKNYTNAPRSRFISTANFPLDEHRYALLAEKFSEFLEPVNEVASGMGEMLSKMHYKACVDGRDIEFVLGGTGSAGFTYFVIDFNQVCTWSKGSDVSPLVSAFFDNDPYYPRPSPDNLLYASFKAGYIGACPSEDRVLATIFLDAIEAEQVARSARRATSSSGDQYEAKAAH